MKSHAAEGARIVHEILINTDDEEFRRITENVAHYHHERFDGSGYPDGLKGDEIPMDNVRQNPRVNAPNEAFYHDEDARRNKSDLRLEAGCVEHDQEGDDLHVGDGRKRLFARREQRCRKRG